MLVRGDIRIAAPSTFRKPAFALYSDYKAMFETAIADSPSLREECFRIRHEVYCVERGFLADKENAACLEQDAYDDHSVHSLLFDRASGLAVGTIRLILNRPSSRSPGMPFHVLCKERLRQQPRLLSPATAEVSRLALSKSRSEIASRYNRNRRRSADLNDIHPRSYVALGLLRMAIEMAVKHGVEYLCAVMEPSLLRMLARCGIHLENLGSCINYHGLRQPVYSHVVTLLDGIDSNRPDVWEVISDIGRFHPGRSCGTDTRWHRTTAHIDEELVDRWPLAVAS